MAGGAADADRRDRLPERTPIVYDGDEKSYQGINADYLALMAHSLGLKVIIRQYDTEQQALTAPADRRGYPAHSGGAPGCARPGHGSIRAAA